MDTPEVAVRYCLSTPDELPLEPDVQRAACRRYLDLSPDGPLVAPVSARLKALTEVAPASQESEPDIDLDDLRHPRHKGDRSFMLGLGLNNPNATVGVQIGQYLDPRVQVGGAFGFAETGFRLGAFGRGYLRNARISPMLVAAVSMSIPREAFAAVPDPVTGLDELNPVRYGTSLLGHLGLGMSLRNITGFSASVEAGYALPFFQQSIINPQDDEFVFSNADDLRDGGPFASGMIGYTF
jgi:hypothetical protein